MTATDVDRPTWLVPGAKVVAYTTGGTGTPRNTVITTVEKIATKTFTIVGSHYRFRIDRMEASTAAGTGWGGTRHVVPLDSPEGQAEVATEKQRRAVQRAEVACEAWMRNRTRESRMAAIAALQAVQDGE